MRFSSALETRGPDRILVKICITGARGRLGSVLSTALGSAGHEVVRLSRNADMQFGCLGTLPTLIRSGADVILHMAWSSVPATAESNRGQIWREDLPLVASILDECCILTKSDKSPLFVFLSSCSVYGRARQGNTTPFEEKDQTNPVGWYASGKIAAENLILNFARSGVKTLILRTSNPYGFPQSFHNAQGILPAALSAAKTGEKLHIWGDGSALKDFIHVQDFCAAVLVALTQGLTGTFNICSGQSTSINEVLAVLEQAVGRPLHREHLPTPDWDVTNATYSNGRLVQETGWTPSLSLQDGVYEFVRRAL